MKGMKGMKQGEVVGLCIVVAAARRLNHTLVCKPSGQLQGFVTNAPSTGVEPQADDSPQPNGPKS